MERMQAVDVVSGQCYYLSVYEYLACVGLKSRGNAARGAGSAHCSVRVSGRESETSELQHCERIRDMQKSSNIIPGSESETIEVA